MALVVLDASVVIAFLDATDPLHTRATEAMAGCRADELVVPASAYAEILVMPYRRGAAAVERVERFVQDFAIRIEPAEREIARQAARFRARHPALRLPDALVHAEQPRSRTTTTSSGSWPRPRWASRGTR